MIEPRYGIFDTKRQMFAASDVDWKSVVDDQTLKFRFAAEAQAFLTTYKEGFDPETTIVKELPST